MSDIKIEDIIAADAENGEHTRFPFLAVVRYAAAAGVTMLALAVIAMVIHAVLRSEDIRLSVNDGYIGADKLWSETYMSAHESRKPTAGAHVGAGMPGDPGSTAATSSRVTQEAIIGRGLAVADQDEPRADTTVTSREPQSSDVAGSFGGGGGDDGDSPGGDPPGAYVVGTNYGNNGATQVTLQRANTTNLRVTLIANNPGGRTKIDCNDTTVSIIVMQMQFPTRYEIGKLELGNFTVPPQTTITLQKRLKITDAAKLSYIWHNYGGEDSFSVVVRVSASVTSYPLGKKTQTETRTYICQQVTLGLIDHETYLAAADRDCIAERQTR